MGSKRLMLQNGLGSLIKEESYKYSRFVDLFSGGSFVSWFAAQEVNKPVISVDLQKYSKILASSVTTRTSSLYINLLKQQWIDKAVGLCRRNPLFAQAKILETQKFTKDHVNKLRWLCKKNSRIGPIWNAYGGHYFSPTQALLIDYLLKYLPKSGLRRTVCLSALIMTASKCVASPGHTAQPFQPTKSAKKFIVEAWKKNIASELIVELNNLNVKRAIKKGGRAYSRDAMKFVDHLTSKDLVFIDPPYSGVQYSRFYHVLETIARGKILSKVEGVGRYPSIEERPQSKYSNVSQSRDELNKLLSKIAFKGASVILTFPSGEASNGLSGKKVQYMSKRWFVVEKSKVHGEFSTMGGNNKNREARKKSRELILYLKPKPKKEIENLIVSL